MLRNQDAIALQLRKYLDSQINTDDFLKKLKNDGYCNSFSLCRAAMRYSGKLRWWEAALEEIANWKGDVSSLENEILLPDADGNKPVTLQTIFERVLHYIVFNQAREPNYPHAKYNQYDFIRPGGLFLLLKEDKEWQVTHIETAAGHFSSDDLIQLLQDHATRVAIQNNLCLIRSNDHVCELSYEDGLWNFYDPNYENGKAKSFNDCAGLAREIRNRLGQDICFELIYLNAKDVQNAIVVNAFPYYAQLLNDNPENLIKEKGFQIIARYPHLIPTFLESLEKAKKMECLQLNASFDKDWTALMSAARNGHTKAIEALCQAGANPNQATKLDGGTALIYAASNGHAEAIEALCKAGAKPDQTTPDGWTALMSAAQENHVGAMEALCNAGADVNLPHSCGATPFLLATQHGHVNIIMQFIKRVDLTQCMNACSTILLNQAKQQNRYQEVNSYFRSQHNGDLPDNISGFTALHLAVFFGHKEIVNILLDVMKLDVVTMNTLCDLAKVMNHVEILASLQSKNQFTQTGITLFDNEKDAKDIFMATRFALR